MVLLVTMKVEFLTRWFSHSKLRYEKEMYETTSKLLSYEIEKKKNQQIEGKSRVTVN